MSPFNFNPRESERLLNAFRSSHLGTKWMFPKILAQRKAVVGGEGGHSRV